MRSVLLLSIVAIGLAGAAPAYADDDAVSVPVNVADLDLSKPADEARLRSRLGRAARSACSSPGIQGVTAHMAYLNCQSAALSKATLQAERAIAAAQIGGNAKVKTARR